jgi:hypothetical protein
MALDEYMIPCMSKKIFGVECLGCGTQRAMALLFNGDFVGAFNMFPAIYTLLLLFASLGLHFIDKKRNYNKPIIYLAITNGIVMIVSFFFKHF